MTDREYFRSKATGDLGYRVERDGKIWVRLDRSGPEVLKEFVEGMWVPEVHRAPLNRQQLGKLTHEFDQVLCRALGRGQEVKRDWLSLKDEERSAWMAFGPGDDGIRDKVFGAVKNVLKGYVGE